jgi:hypothetical protein
MDRGCESPSAGAFHTVTLLLLVLLAGALSTCQGFWTLKVVCL